MKSLDQSLAQVLGSKPWFYPLDQTLCQLLDQVFPPTPGPDPEKDSNSGSQIPDSGSSLVALGDHNLQFDPSHPVLSDPAPAVLESRDRMLLLHGRRSSGNREF